MLPLIGYIKSPRKLGIAIIKQFWWLPDAVYLRLRFRFEMQSFLHIKHPVTFNEKLQWLKLYNRRSQYRIMVDKYAVKQYVQDVIGKDLVIPTIGVWDRFEDIDFDSLPNRFVLKTTNGAGGGGVVICRDKKSFDLKQARKKLDSSLKVDIYKTTKEWPYKGLRRRIIAEQYLEDESGELHDFKFFCFNGKARVFKLDFGRFTEHHANYYDSKGKLLPFGEAGLPPVPQKMLHIPQNLSSMIDVAEKLSQGIPFLRVDLYNVNGHIYFGELTFFPASGFGRFTSEEWDAKLGLMIQLPFE